MLLKIVPTATLTAVTIAAAATMISWTGTSANAQQTSLCYERCTGQYGWPQDQCAQFCKRQDAERAYGYTSGLGGGRGFAGGCGEYKYWSQAGCLDARDKPPR